MDEPNQTSHPRKTVGKRPASLEAAAESPKYKALMATVIDAHAGEVPDNATAYARATRSEEDRVGVGAWGACSSG